MSTFEKCVFDEKQNIYTFPCPHCNLLVQVERNQINCSIFRHGYFFTNVNNKIILGNQLEPHASKERCESLAKENKIIGCGKPFRLNKQKDDYHVAICDYI
jgi:hypothetical protein